MGQRCSGYVGGRRALVKVEARTIQCPTVSPASSSFGAAACRRSPGFDRPVQSRIVAGIGLTLGGGAAPSIVLFARPLLAVLSTERPLSGWILGISVVLLPCCCHLATIISRAHAIHPRRTNGVGEELHSPVASEAATIKTAACPALAYLTPHSSRLHGTSPGMRGVLIGRGSAVRGRPRRPAFWRVWDAACSEPRSSWCLALSRLARSCNVRPARGNSAPAFQEWPPSLAIPRALRTKDSVLPHWTSLPPRPLPTHHRPAAR